MKAYLKKNAFKLFLLIKVSLSTSSDNTKYLLRKQKLLI